jgi:thioredoxin-like negative regulator of GroEL
VCVKEALIHGVVFRFVFVIVRVCVSMFITLVRACAFFCAAGQCLELNGNVLEAQHGLAQNLSAFGGLSGQQEAVTILRRALDVAQNYPSLTDMYILLADTYFALGRFKEAKETVDKALGDARVKKGQVTGKLQMQRGRALFRMGDYVNSEKSLSDAVKLLDSDSRAHYHLAHTLDHLQRAEEALAQVNHTHTHTHTHTHSHTHVHTPACAVVMFMSVCAHEPAVCFARSFITLPFFFFFIIIFFFLPLLLPLLFLFLFLLSDAHFCFFVFFFSLLFCVSCVCFLIWVSVSLAAGARLAPQPRPSGRTLPERQVDAPTKEI